MRPRHVSALLLVYALSTHPSVCGIGICGDRRELERCEGGGLVWCDGDPNSERERVHGVGEEGLFLKSKVCFVQPQRMVDAFVRVEWIQCVRIFTHHLIHSLGRN